MRNLHAGILHRVHASILPSGALLLESAPGCRDDGLAPAARTRLARAFERGAGHALLDLGATELDASLAPDLAFLRDVGRAFVTRLCAVPDLEDRRERVEIECPPDERARLAGAVPPMDGAEYVDGDWVAARWARAQSCVRRRDPRASRARRRLAPRAPSVVAHRRQGLPAPGREPRRRRPPVRLPRHLRRARRGRRQGPAPAAGQALEEYSGAQGPPGAAAAAGAAAARRRASAVAERAGRLRRGLPGAGLDAGARRTGSCKDIPAFEDSGLVVRVPDWWQRAPARRGRGRRQRRRQEAGAARHRRPARLLGRASRSDGEPLTGRRAARSCWRRPAGWCG